MRTWILAALAALIGGMLAAGCGSSDEQQKAKEGDYAAEPAKNPVGK